VKNFWEGFVATLKKLWAGFLKWIIGPGAALIVLVVAVILIVVGVKDVQIGGILAKFFGKREGKKPIDVINTPDPKRVDKDGKIIPPGTPDEKGMTQAVVVPLKKPGLFDSKDQVKVQEPGKDKPTIIDLPKGVKAKDVEKVVIVRPEITAVTVKSSSKVKANDIDDLLEKYGGG
jgi:hypothetical protein